MANLARFGEISPDVGGYDRRNHDPEPMGINKKVNISGKSLEELGCYRRLVIPPNRVGESVVNVVASVSCLA